MSLESAFKRPFQDIKTFLIGALISIIPIVNLAAVGYALECARRTFKKDNSLPEWTDWGKLFLDGIKAFVIQIVYSIPVFIIFFLTIGGTVLGVLVEASTGDVGALMGAIGTAGIGLIVTSIASVIVSLFALVGTLRFAVTGSFEDAFKFRELKPFALSWKLLGRIIIVSIVGVVLILVASLIPIAGVAAGMFVINVFAYSVYAETLSELGLKPSRAKPASVRKKK